MWVENRRSCLRQEVGRDRIDDALAILATTHALTGAATETLPSYADESSHTVEHIRAGMESGLAVRFWDAGSGLEIRSPYRAVPVLLPS